MRHWRRLLCGLFIILFTLIPLSALAEGEDTGGTEASPSPSPTAEATPSPVPAEASTPTPEVTLSDLLRIDNTHVYPNMNRSFEDGYMPAVSDGVCYAVLPLVASERISKNTITITPDYGDTAASPFIFNNVQQSVPLQGVKFEGENKTTAVYLVNLALPLKQERVNGTYPLKLKANYKGWNGQALSQEFTLFVTITDGKDADETEVNFKPPVYIEQYAIDPQTVEAGSEFTVTLTLKNASDTDNVKNVKLSYKGETTALIPTDNSNTLFITSLGRGNTKEFSFTMKALPDAEAKAHKVLITIEYEDAKAATITATDELPVQVTQPIRLEYDTPVLAQSVNAGDTISLSMQVRNMGKSQLNNVLVKLDAPGLLPESSAYLGNMEAGTAKSAELLVFVGMKTMTADGGTQSGDAEKYGYTSGTITISYEDSYGTPYSEMLDISTTINPPVIPVTTPEPEEEEPRASQWWISVLIGAAVIAAGIFVITIRNKRRKQQVGYDEAD